MHYYPYFTDDVLHYNQDLGAGRYAKRHNGIAHDVILLVSCAAAVTA